MKNWVRNKVMEQNIQFWIWIVFPTDVLLKQKFE